MQPPPAKPPRITCPKCGGQNPELARFCNRCGADLTARPSSPSAGPPTPALAPTAGHLAAPSAANPLVGDPPPPPESRSCPACRTPNPAVARFCQHCGADLSRPPASLPSPTASASAGGRKICPGCHAFNPAAAGFCAECGVTLPKEATTPTFGGPAGFWIRFVAFAIDMVLMAIVDTLVADRLGFPELDPERLGLQRYLIDSSPELLLSLVTSSIYGMLMIGTWGGTVGKLVLGLRVVRFSDGGRVPYGLALGRQLAEILSLLGAGLGYLWVALTPSKRAWHDYLCDTRVVRVRPQ